MVREGEDRSIRSAHLLRFGAALALLIAVSLAGVALEQRSLELSRRSSLQTFRADRLEHDVAELRLKIEQLQTPQRLMQAAGNPADNRHAQNPDRLDTVGSSP